jgi:hypothetical protein
MTYGPIFARRNREDHIGQSTFISRHPLRRRFKADDHMSTEVGGARIYGFGGPGGYAPGYGPAMYTPQQLAVMRMHARRLLPLHLHGAMGAAEAAAQAGVTAYHGVPGYAPGYALPQLTPAQHAMMTMMPWAPVPLGKWPHLVIHPLARRHY